MINDWDYIIYINNEEKICAYNGTSEDIDFKGKDVTRVIQNAINVLTNGGDIFIKNGAYATIDTNLNIGNNINFIGEGVNTKFILGQHGHILANNKSNIKISNIFVDGTNQTIINDPPSGNTGCLSIVGRSNNISVDHIAIKGAPKFGMNIYNSTNVVVDQSTIQDVVGFGIYVGVSSGVTIQNCRLNGKGVADVIGGNGTNNTYDLRDIIVRNNVITQDASVGNNYGTAIDMTNVYRTTFIDNITYGDIWFGGEQYPHRYSKISGNIVKPAIGKTSCFIAIDANASDNIGDKYISITDNIIESGYIQVNGAVSTYAIYGIISNNSIDGSFAPYGMRLKYCSEFNIIGNLIIGNKLILDDATKTIVKGNQFSGGSIGIEELNTTGYSTIQGNYFNNIKTPISTLATTDIIRNNQGYKTECNVLSGTFVIDSIGIKTVTIDHGLAIIPAVQDCYLTVIKNTDVTDWAYNLLIIDSVSSTNVVSKINVSTVSGTGGATAKLGLRIGNP